jgi:hypothetical protein
MHRRRKRRDCCPYSTRCERKHSIIRCLTVQVRSRYEWLTRTRERRSHRFDGAEIGLERFGEVLSGKICVLPVGDVSEGQVNDAIRGSGGAMQAVWVIQAAQTRLSPNLSQ